MRAMSKSLKYLFTLNTLVSGKRDEKSHKFSEIKERTHEVCMKLGLFCGAMVMQLGNNMIRGVFVSNLVVVVVVVVGVVSKE